MSYRISLGEDAALTFAKLPRLLQQHLSAELRRLALDPAGLSRPAHFPHPRDGQLFHLEPIFHEGFEHFFTAMFKYHQETTLVVEWISHIKRPVE